VEAVIKEKYQAAVKKGAFYALPYGFNQYKYGLFISRNTGIMSGLLLLQGL